MTLLCISETLNMLFKKPVVFPLPKLNQRNRVLIQPHHFLRRFKSPHLHLHAYRDGV